MPTLDQSMNIGASQDRYVCCDCSIIETTRWQARSIMARTLKVYKTPIGFHDAYVAVTSKKAALEAWGTSVNLFARGAADEVTDPALMAEALAHPGEVLRKVRGTEEEHLAALPHDVSEGKPRSKSVPTTKPVRKPNPRPSRYALDAAEAAIEAEKRRHDDDRLDFARRIAELEEERDQRAKQHQRVMEKREKARAGADAKFSAAMKKWRSQT